MRFPCFNDAWEQKTIKSITTISAGATPKTTVSSYWGGNIKWMNSGELNNKHIYDVAGRITESGFKNTSTKLLPKDCVLIGLAGQGKTRGTVAINHVELCTNQSIAAIWPCKILNPLFLYFNIDSRYNELRELSSGDGGRGGLNLSLIGSLKVPLCTLAEQDKIASFLSLIEERINTQNKNINQIKSQIKQIRDQIFLDNDCSSTKIENFLSFEQPTKYLVRTNDYENFSNDLTPVLTANKAFILGYTKENDNIYKNLPCIIFDDFTMDIKYVDFPFKVKSSAIKILRAKEPILTRYAYEFLKYCSFESKEHKRHYISEIEPKEITIPNIEKIKLIVNLFSALSEKEKIEKSRLELFNKQKTFLLNKLFI